MYTAQHVYDDDSEQNNLTLVFLW